MSTGIFDGAPVRTARTLTARLGFGAGLLIALGGAISMPSCSGKGGDGPRATATAEPAGSGRITTATPPPEPSWTRLRGPDVPRPKPGAVMSETVMVAEPVAVTEPPASAPAVSAEPAAPAVSRPSITVGGTGETPAAAARFDAYVARASALNGADLLTPKRINNALEDLRGFNSAELAGDWIARGAMQAASHEGYAEAVRRAAESQGVEAFLAAIRADPSIPMYLPQADGARRRILDAIVADDQMFGSLAAHLKQTAYAFQNTKWGFLMTPEGGLGQSVASLGEAMLMGAASVGDAVAQFALGGAAHAQANFQRGTPDNPSVMERMMSLAAHQALGASEPGRAQFLMRESEMTRCLDWSKVNITQCLAAAKFPSETAFCTGEHAVGEISRCWSWLVPPGY